jgi:hypothetical protein
LITAARCVELSDEGGANALDGKLADYRRPRSGAENAARPIGTTVRWKPTRAHPNTAEGPRIECQLEERLTGAELWGQTTTIGTHRRPVRR